MNQATITAPWGFNLPLPKVGEIFTYDDRTFVVAGAERIPPDEVEITGIVAAEGEAFDWPAIDQVVEKLVDAEGNLSAIVVKADSAASQLQSWARNIIAEGRDSIPEAELQVLSIGDQKWLNGFLFRNGFYRDAKTRCLVNSNARKKVIAQRPLPKLGTRKLCLD